MSLRLLLLLSVAVLASACQPRIGDSCSSYVNCDINGSRICDLSSPSGYCTQRNCDVGTCPQSEALCVQFGTELRVAENFCMRRCNADSDCRVSQGYACLTATQVGGLALDVSDGGTEAKFCVVAPISGSPDAGTAAVDAGGD